MLLLVLLLTLILSVAKRKSIPRGRVMQDSYTRQIKGQL